MVQWWNTKYNCCYFHLKLLCNFQINKLLCRTCYVLVG
jgi:hypothetical protein